jgi:CHAT domain-containing protein
MNTSARDTELDVAAARELYLFLIAPFEDKLDAKQILIVPQGPLVGLPFETLIAPEPGSLPNAPKPGEPLIERWAVSYAPNATMALKALKRAATRFDQMTAIVDDELAGANYVRQVFAAAGLRPRVLPAGEVMPDRFAESLAGSEAVHVLVHGQFNSYEPLLSELKTTERPSMYASEIVGMPLSGLSLAVMSACEGSQVGARLSNEIYGFPWALLVSGVETVVLSRWQANAASSAFWMRHFYKAIADGASPAEAAAAAMRTMRAKREERNTIEEDRWRERPYHWAVMQVTGR